MRAPNEDLLPNYPRDNAASLVGDRMVAGHPAVLMRPKDGYGVWKLSWLQDGDRLELLVERWDFEGSALGPTPAGFEKMAAEIALRGG